MDLTEIKSFNGSQFYEKFLLSFCVKPGKKRLNLSADKVTRALFYHLYRVLHAEWEMRIRFQRHVKHSISDFLQDLIAFYLRLGLGPTFQVELEHTYKKDGKTFRPDIVVRYRNKPIFIVEVMTTAGWKREWLEGKDPEESYPERIKALSKVFAVRINRIVYIFVCPGNIDKRFNARYWDSERSEPKKRPKGFPYSNYYPLFCKTPDPYYWRYERGFNKQQEFKPRLTPKKLFKRSEFGVIFPLERIIETIRSAAS